MSERGYRHIEDGYIWARLFIDYWFFATIKTWVWPRLGARFGHSVSPVLCPAFHPPQISEIRHSVLKKAKVSQERGRDIYERVWICKKGVVRGRKKGESKRGLEKRKV